MSTTRPKLFTVYETNTITRAAWDRFAALAIRDDGTITNALAALIRQYTEQHSQDRPSTTAEASAGATRPDTTR
jgi:hypothetical protein